VSSICFEPESPSSGTRLYVQIWYSVFYMHQYKQSCRWKCGVSNTLLYLQDCLYWYM